MATAVGGGGLAMTTLARVVVGDGGLAMNPTPVALVGGAGSAVFTAGALVGDGALTTIRVVGVVAVVGGSVMGTTSVVSVGSGDSPMAAAAGAVVGGGGLVMTRPSFDPHPAPKAVTSTTGTAKLTRRRNVLWRAPLRGTPVSGCRGLVRITSAPLIWAEAYGRVDVCCLIG